MDEKFAKRVKEGREQLKVLRDEIRVKLHLAGMDAKDQWAKLEPEIEHALASAENAAGKALDKLNEKLQRFNETI